MDCRLLVDRGSVSCCCYKIRWPVYVAMILMILNRNSVTVALTPAASSRNEVQLPEQRRASSFRMVQSVTSHRAVLRAASDDGQSSSSSSTHQMLGIHHGNDWSFSRCLAFLNIKWSSLQDNPRIGSETPLFLLKFFTASFYVCYLKAGSKLCNLNL